MLKSISLENYKCFKKKTDIEIAPLTVLCGVNSSGKSSILKSLLMLKQSYESSSNGNFLALNGKYTNNGTFKDVVNGRKGSLFKISNSFEIKNGTYMTTQEKNLLKDINSVFQCKNKEISFVTLDVELIIKSQNRKNLSYGDNTIEDIFINLKTNIKNKSTTINFNHIQERKYNITICGLTNNKIDLIDTTCHFDGLKIVALYYDQIHPVHQKNVNEILTAICTISRIIASQYKDIFYISPLRYAPQRRYIIEQDVEDIGIYGENVPQILEKYKEINGRINEIPIDDKISSKYIPIKSKTKEAVNKWLNYLNIDNLDVNSMDELLKLSIGNDNILDVGFGISQALPIVVNGVVLPYETTLLLEQPEVHLHPEMQLRMADLLISVSMAHKNVIVETHSDHIINRIVRRIVEDKTDFLQKNIKLFFIDKQFDKVITPIVITNTQGVIDAPKEFFSQFADETQKIIFAAVKNRK